MELLNEINFLTKPKINFDSLNFIQDTKNIYINLYEIRMRKELKIYQYPFMICPEIEDGDIRIRHCIFKAAHKDLKSIYSVFIASGNSLYSTNKINEKKIVKISLLNKQKTQYLIEINKYVNEIRITPEEITKNQLTKQIIELIIIDILSSNPRLELYKDIFVITDSKKIINTLKTSIKFYQGFSTSLMETDSGNYLNVVLKSRIIQNETILDYI